MAEEVGRAKRQAADARRSDLYPADPALATGTAEEADWKCRLDRAIAELNQRYFVAAMGGSVRIASLVDDDSLRRERLVFMRESDIRLRYRHFKVGESQRGLDIVKGLGDAWLNHQDRRTYDRIALIIDGPCPVDVYNLWRGFGVKPKAGRWPTIDAHLRIVICSNNLEYYKWLIGWLAYIVQNPGRQAEVAVVLRGRKGAGKGMVGQMLILIFRDHSLQITQSKHFTGHFNAHLVDTLFLFIDEAFWAGDKQGEGTLKALITERMVMIEPKGVDLFPMPNRFKIRMSSNNNWVIPVTSDERRYFVLDVSDSRMGDRAYFTKLTEAIEGDELPALLDYLLKLDLSNFDHRNLPHTEALNRQKIIDSDSFPKYWIDCLYAGYLPGTGEGDWPQDVVCEVLHAAYVEHAHHHGDRHPLTMELLGIRLRELSPPELRTIRPRKPWNGVERPTRYALLGLQAHRIAFTKAMRIDPDHYQWPEE